MKLLQLVLICLSTVSLNFVEASYGRSCTFEYMPVCSRNNKNKCETDLNFCYYTVKAQYNKNARWDLASFEACPGRGQCPPEFACATAGACYPEERDSVCAIDGDKYRYFINFCEYQVGKCGNSNLRVYSKGECPAE